MVIGNDGDSGGIINYPSSWLDVTSQVPVISRGTCTHKCGCGCHTGEGTGGPKSTHGLPMTSTRYEWVGVWVVLGNPRVTRDNH